MSITFNLVYFLQSPCTINKHPVEIGGFMWKIPQLKREISKLKEHNAPLEPLTSDEFHFNGGKWRMLLNVPQYKLFLQLLSSVEFQRVNVR